MANDTDRLDFRPGLKFALSEFEILRQAIRDSARRRTDMLLETEGVILATAGGGQLLVSRASAVTVSVAAGMAYLDGDYINVATAQTLTRPTGGAPGAYYVKLRHATTNNEPGTISVSAAGSGVLGNGTRFSRMNPGDRFRIASGANVGNYRILAIASDTSMLVRETFSANQSAIADWYYLGNYSVGYETDDPLGVYDSYTLIFNSVAPVAGVDVALATVTLDANLEIASSGAITDTRGTNLLRIKPGLTNVIVDTYGIYPNNLIQDHIDAVGSINPAGWAALTNPHAMSAADLPVPGSPTTNFTFSTASRASTFLNELVHAFMLRRYVGATAMYPVTMSRTAIGDVQVLAALDAAENIAQFYWELPRNSVIGWDTGGVPPFTLNLQVEVIATGDAAAAAGNVRFQLALYWLEVGAGVQATVAATVGVTVGVPGAASQLVARGTAAANLDLTSLNTSNGRLSAVFRRQGNHALDTYTGTAHVIGVGLTVAGYEG